MSGESKSHYKVTVEAGTPLAAEYLIAETGARLGRSSQNDIAIPDPLLSRHHCRFEMRAAELWLVDLASANQTIVNDQTIDECRLHAGDTVKVGDTILRVAAATGTEPPAPAPNPNQLAAASAVPTLPGAPANLPVIDLGLDHRQELPPAASHKWRPLLWCVAAIAILLIGIFVLVDTPPPPPKPFILPEVQDHTLQILYEKVEADPSSIFRYEMTLSPANDIAIRIDDLRQDNHPRKELRIPEAERVRDLARELLSSGFFKLDDAYIGINPQPGALTSWDLTIIVGRQAHRCRVVNRLEPEVFRNVRERIETFGKNELGIWAIQFSRDKLLTLAADAFRVGRKFYDERGIQYGNLFQSIVRLKEAEFYLETVEPKPDFFTEITECRRQATEELDRRYKDQCFRADRASNLGEWQTAAQELRILRDLLPDRNDDRYKDATRKLIDVEARLKARRK
jgi:hypothetical protein